MHIKITKHLNYRVALITLSTIFVGLGILTLVILSWKINCGDSDQVITIPRGASAKTVSTILKYESCIQNEIILKLALTLTMNNRKIMPGRYSFKGIHNVGQLVKMLTSPSSDRIRLTFIEGWTIENYADYLKEKLDLDTYTFLELCNDINFLHALGIDAPSAEGFLFPDTYIMLKSYTERDIIEILINQFKYNYKKLIKKNNYNNELNMRQVATLASIIQGEAMFVDEMTIISSVYHNRLRKKMLLQADPTIQYILPGKSRRLYNKDLKVDNPYNTYIYKGLPPGPINNPGIDALYSAISPSNTNYLFFVANGEGRHIFTKTHREHNNAKNKIRNKRK